MSKLVRLQKDLRRLRSDQGGTESRGSRKEALKYWKTSEVLGWP